MQQLVKKYEVMKKHIEHQVILYLYLMQIVEEWKPLRIHI